MMTRKPLALLVAATILCFPPPARADDFLDSRITSPFFGPTDGVVPGAKKVVAMSLLVGSVVTYGVSFVFLAQANAAESDRKAFLQGISGVTEGPGAGCRTPAECATLSGLSADRDAARDRWFTALGVGGFVGAASVATILFWPNVSRDSVKVAPQANAGGGGLTLVGSF